MSAAAAELSGRRPAPAPPAAHQQLGLRLLAFFSLAAFAAVHYAGLIAAPPIGRVLLVAACVTAGCGLLAASGRLRRPAVAATLLRVAIVLGTFVVAMLALRIPAHTMRPGEWGQLEHKLSGGLGNLGGWLWPYRGADRWAQAAVLLPVPAVLLAAGCAWFWPSPAMFATRRALALGALLAIFVTGTANAQGSVPAFDGVVLLGLLAAALLLPLPSASDTGRAVCWLCVCAAGALGVQSALRSAGPWIHYRDGNAAGGAGASFQWDQLYGPSRWPGSQESMLTVAESTPALLRITSLDRFDGLRFLRSVSPPGSPRLDLPGANRRRWSRRAIVEIRGLRTSMLASAGGLLTSTRWLDYAEPVPRRATDGTATTATMPVAGGVYEATSYDPRPSLGEARRAPRRFPRAYLPYAQFELPVPGASALARPDLAAEAHRPPDYVQLVGPSRPGRAPASDPATAALIEASPYGPMFALARRLAAGAPSSYDVAERIARFLRSNYAYDRRVPLTRYPLEAFLFTQRRGYCQQFSGAMTLMLRMDGIPARVGAGFRPAASGAQDGTWNVRAADAHAWVEVFISGIGWVDFDPTPASQGAAPRQEATALSRAAVFGGGGSEHSAPQALGTGTAHIATAGEGGAHPPVAWLIGGVLGGVLGLAAVAVMRGRSRMRQAFAGDAEGATAELRRALARLGAGEPELTLAGLERRLADEGHGQAAAYVRSLRTRRFASAAGAGGLPGGRAELRRALAPSRGIGGRLRALASLPPAWLALLRVGRAPRL